MEKSISKAQESVTILLDALGKVDYGGLSFAELCEAFQELTVLCKQLEHEYLMITNPKEIIEKVRRNYK